MGGRGKSGMRMAWTKESAAMQRTLNEAYGVKAARGLGVKSVTVLKEMYAFGVTRENQARRLAGHNATKKRRNDFIKWRNRNNAVAAAIGLKGTGKDRNWVERESQRLTRKMPYGIRFGKYLRKLLRTAIRNQVKRS